MKNARYNWLRAQGTIDALHEQAGVLGEEDRESGPVLERLSSIDRRSVNFLFSLITNIDWYSLYFFIHDE